MTINMLAYKNHIPASKVEIPAYSNLINGSIAGAIAGFATNPFDLIKTRLMTFQSN